MINLVKINDFNEILIGCRLICKYDFLVKISKEEMIEIFIEVIFVLFLVNM